jgi:hypothetical protein
VDPPATRVAVGPAAAPLPLRRPATYHDGVPLPVASAPRTGRAGPVQPSAPVLLTVGLLLGVVLGWLAGLIRVRTP